LEVIMSVEQFASAFLSARLARIANARAVAAVVVGLGGVAAMIGTALDRMLTAHERWRQRQALLALDDHLLKDIGITRVDVEREIGKSLWED
jgi:uncharacterized protein YjiS (DUF1127 family)